MFPWLKTRVLRDADTGGAGAGAGATGGAAPGAAPGAAAGGDPAAGAGATGGAAPGANAAFDWKGLNLAPDLALLVEQRQWKSPADAIGSYRSLEQHMGLPPERLLKLPTEKSTPEEWNAVFDRLGRPKDHNAYQIPLPEGDKGEFAKAMAPIFHKAGLTQAQVKTLAEEANKMTGERVQAETAAAKAKHDAEVAQLKEEWGDLYQQNAEIVDRAGAAFGVTAEQVKAIGQVLGPKATMKFFFDIGTKIAVEGQFVGGDKAGSFSQPGGARTPEMARAEVRQLMNDKTFIQEYHSSDITVRKAARERIEQLNKQAYPGQTVIV